VSIRGRSFAIGAHLLDVGAYVQGVIFAHGSRFGGHTLYVKNRRLHYVYNFLGMEQQRFAASVELPAGDVSVGMAFEKTGEEPEFVPYGDVQLVVAGDTVATGTMRTQPGKFTLAGDGLCVGWDSADAVSADYRAPFRFRGGRIELVAVDVSGESVVDLEREFQALLARD
jgi:arylsulfatase